MMYYCCRIVMIYINWVESDGCFYRDEYYGMEVYREVIVDWYSEFGIGSDS